MEPRHPSRPCRPPRAERAERQAAAGGLVAVLLGLAVLLAGVPTSAFAGLAHHRCSPDEGCCARTELPSCCAARHGTEHIVAGCSCGDFRGSLLPEASLTVPEASAASVPHEPVPSTTVLEVEEPHDAARRAPDPPPPR